MLPARAGTELTAALKFLALDPATGTRLRDTARYGDGVAATATGS
jgi:hypothetical protein